MGKELPKAYEPGEYEDRIYKKWEESGFFNPDNLSLEDNAESYTISLPPPNVTGTLHMGHAAMLAIEDILMRFHRMNGYKALWVPGTDHAAIATNAKVEKILKEEGTNRHELGREEFLKRVKQFAQDSHDTIINQVKKMGSSCDWSREAYTLDETRHKVVYSVFKKMYDDGLIYRGERIVNWCPRCHSTLADDEVEHKEKSAKLYTFKYDKSFPFAVASTRPETKLGDTAVAVHPDDERYKKYIGKTYDVNFIGNKLELKIISDKQIDPEFGTGALGVTPAHSMIDSIMAEENNLKSIKVINEDGIIHDGFGDYSGKDVIEARGLIVEKLRELDLIEKEEDIQNNISLCYRCDTPVEPLPSLQWFIDVNKKMSEAGSRMSDSINWQGKSIKDICLEVVREGKIKIVPKRFEKNYFHWMENLRDWCISRQIWFGHRVPVWYRGIADCRLPIADLNFRNREMFDLIKSGKKTVETRALNPEEPDRYFGNIKSGDVLRLKYLEDEKLVNEIKVKVKRTQTYKTTEEMLKNENMENIWPDKDQDDLVDFQRQIPNYIEKIKKNGLIALELENIENKPKSEIRNPKSEIYVGVEPPKGKGWVQDEDTLDTWFSSGLWTFSTLAHSPEEISIENGRLMIDSEDFRVFHPTAVLETGYDILFFWVARMIIMTTYSVGDIPFKDVYLHGLVRDEEGRKMSKSLGNVIDPLIMCEKYGTDATRLSLMIGSTPGNDMKLSEEKIAGFRNFANKLWNVSRFIIMSVDESNTNVKDRSSDNSQNHPPTPSLSKEGESAFNMDDLTLSDKWILSKLDTLNKEVTVDIKEYRLSQAGEKLREFTWSDLADWYLEVSKFEKNKEKNNVLTYVLTSLIKLWHPFIPFVTEVIWQEMGNTGDRGNKGLLMVEEWPKIQITDNKSQIFEEFEVVKEVISSIRNARAVNKVEPGRKIKAVIYAGKHADMLNTQVEIIKGLRTGISELEIKEGGDKIEKSIFIAVGKIEIYLIGAVDEEKEKKRIKNSIERLEQLIKMTESKLADKNFVERAPEPIVEKERARLEEFRVEIKKLKEQIARL